MRFSSRWIFVVGVAVAAFITLFLPAHAFDKNDRFSVAGMTELQAKQFLTRLQKAVGQGNKQAVADLANYPLSVFKHGNKRQIQSRAEFVQQYDKLLTPGLKQVILKQDPDKLFANYQGVMLDRGQLWFANYAYPNYNLDKILIKTINQ